MSDCLFCRIIAGEIPSEKVYEDEWTFAFKDINPQAPQHILVIPKEHIENIVDPKLLENDLATKIMAAIQKITEQQGMREKGFRVIVNRGDDAGEEVHHLHFHIVAGRQFGWPPG